MLGLSKDTHSLSALQGNSLQFLRHLRSSGSSPAPTIHGAAGLVIQDVKPYQKRCAPATESAGKTTRTE